MKQETKDLIEACMTVAVSFAFSWLAMVCFLEIVFWCFDARITLKEATGTWLILAAIAEYVKNTL